MTAPTIVCRVTRPFADPIPARVGDILVAWPGHSRNTLTITCPSGFSVLASVPYPDADLYPLLLRLFLDGAIRPGSVAAERELLGVKDAG